MKVPCLRNISFYLFVFSVTIWAAGCKKTPVSTVNANVPTVATTSVIINLTSTTAESGGVIVTNGYAAVTANGVCYSSTNQTPTISDSKTSDSVSTSSNVAYTAFYSNLTGLTPNTTYYLRAYATNTAGVGYGGVVKFTTSASLTSFTATVSTFAGTQAAGYQDGPALSAMFNNPTGLTVDNSGNLFVSDSFNDLIREVSSGNASTVAGIQTLGYLNGPALTAQFYAPNGEAFDAAGNLYVADQGNNVIRKITPAGVVSTYAGTGRAGYRNGAVDSAHLTSSSDSLAMFRSPQGVAVDASGNVYVADRGNNAIRIILPTGRTKTVAGNAVKGFIDATDAAAFFNNPTGIAVDASGNLYVTDQGNSALRKITPAGVVTTIVGNPSQTSLLGYPSGITIDKQGNLYIVDENGRIFEFTTANVLYQVAGATGITGLVNGNGTDARFDYPQGITVDASGNLYVTDQYNNCIRKIVITTN